MLFDEMMLKERIYFYTSKKRATRIAKKSIYYLYQKNRCNIHVITNKTVAESMFEAEIKII